MPGANVFAAARIAVRNLPVALTVPQIKHCLYRFRRVADAATDVEINDIDGRTVMIRAAEASVLERDWDALCHLAQQAAVEHGDGDARSYERTLDHAPDRRYAGPAELLDAGIVRRYPDGRPYLVGPAAQLLYAIDRLFLEFAATESAVPFYAEPTWSRDDLGNFGYPEGSSDLLHLTDVDGHESRVWQNATCDNIWKALRGAEIAAPQAYTAVATCCRNEPYGVFMLERMRTFHMREIVLAGTPEHVTRFRERALEFAVGLVQRFELNAFIESAADPFFLAGAGSALPEGLTTPEIIKLELRLRLYDNKSLACASFNVHGNFFSQKLGYRRPDGGPTWTSCAAFGIERWVWALLVQLGPKPERWPEPLRRLASS